MKPTIFGIYGYSNTGKTTLIVDIIKHFMQEGLNIATIKITDKKISIDKEQKDTWKYNNAGSNLVVFSSPIETDFLHFKSLKTDEILKYINKIGKYDIIIIEGAHDKNIPKIKIGNIKERENTILTYNGNFKELIKIIKNGINRWKKWEI